VIAVVDVCSGNLRSVARALTHVGGDVVVTRDAADIRRADKLVVPGQGAFDVFMHELASRGLRDALQAALAHDVPYLGICLGMQVLFEHGDEGDCGGLGVFAGRVERLVPHDAHKVPHVGWNQVTRPLPSSLSTLPSRSLAAAVPDGTYFYFTHSYRAVPTDRSVIALETDHGVPICAAIQRGRLFACQFHPEKSQAAGLRLLSAFVHDEATA
jgi:glutamine amidotransferase